MPDRAGNNPPGPAVDTLLPAADTGPRKPEDLPVETLIVYWLPAAIVFGLFTSTVAGEKGHSESAWFLGGAIFGPFALLAAVGLPDLKLRKYLRLLAEQHGALDYEPPLPPKDPQADADAQRRRILGRE